MIVLAGIALVRVAVVGSKKDEMNGSCWRRGGGSGLLAEGAEGVSEANVPYAASWEDLAGWHKKNPIL